MTRDKAIEIIRKCLALAENNNSLEEAKTAALKAQELMARFSIEHAELTLQQTQVVHAYITEWGRIPLWRKALAQVIATNYRCFWYLQTRNGESIIVFVGLEGEIELARNVFKLMESKILDSWREYEQERRKKANKGLVSDGTVSAYNMMTMDNVGTKNDFIFGFLEGLRGSFKKNINDNGYYIIMSLSPIVQKEFDRLRLDFKEEKGVKSAGNDEAKTSGKEKGESAM